ncbi:hypothetical protein BC936DRAFT_147621 [Jimgerdemannia flammicorona]|uniref:Translation initiation factor IF-2, chloroplastic n=1 Tax=Jimgerdemannia flammicorona TaxID=994334 RepID=A0A433D4Y8_9FUNG|nr:hypothetical protein BC936DRAFT_147621 [Jimgerdemannia flammicorona]
MAISEDCIITLRIQQLQFLIMSTPLVDLPSGKRITFLDTPGHAAFSAMRSRGANVTDIVVLVVAADDGVMPQTIEAIKHAQAANVPIVVAINKCDKHDADPRKAKEGLLQHGIQLEEFGGETPAVEVSGITGLGLPELEETVVTLAEVLELRADKGGAAEGVVIESQVEKGRGTMATVLVKQGTLTVGSYIVAGTTWCKIRSMTDDKGRPVKEAGPGAPVKVIGWKEMPNAGDEILQAEDEVRDFFVPAHVFMALAKTVVENRITKQQRETQLRDLEVINDKRRKDKEAGTMERAVEKAQRKELWMFHHGMIKDLPDAANIINEDDEGDTKKAKVEVKEFRAVVKGDVSGTVGTVIDCLNGLCTPEIKVKVVGSGVGNITDGDVQLAAACEGFNVKTDRKIQHDASVARVPIKSYDVIYKLLDDIKLTLGEMLPPIVTTQVNGEATVLQIFQINTQGRETKAVAGCRVTNGSMTKIGRVRIIRDHKQIWEGELETLRQVKKDIMEAKKGLECGMSFNDFYDFKEGDVIQSVVTVTTPRSYNT